MAVVADRRPDGRIEELRVYSTAALLGGGPTSRPPLLQPDPAPLVPAAVAEALDAIYEPLLSRSGGTLEACGLVDDGRACALEYNVVRSGSPRVPRQAGFAAFVSGDGGRLAAVRVYDDLAPPVAGS